MLLVTVPVGSPAAAEPDTLLGCVLIETGRLVFCNDQSTVLVCALLMPSEMVQYIVPVLVEFASTVPVTPVVAEFGAVKVAEPLAMVHV